MSQRQDSAPHAGHRQRVRARLLSEGPDAMAPHELLEFILFYAIPKRDVNPLAHRLIDRFGSLSGVLAADESELRAVDGMGAAAAGLIKRVHEAVEAAAEPDEEIGLTAATPQAALALAMARLKKPARQELCLISVDAQGAPRRCEAMPWDAFTPAAVKALVRSALDCGDDRLILVWKRLGRPRGLSPAEQADVGALLSALSQMDIYLCDLMLVHEGAVTTLRADGLLRDGDGAPPCAFMSEWDAGLQAL